LRLAFILQKKKLFAMKLWEISEKEVADFIDRHKAI